MRLFIGVPVSEEIKEKVKPLYQKLKETDAIFNLVPLDNLHFTIKFLGDVDESKLEEIKGKLSEIKQSSFKISLKGIGAFPSLERINVIWIGTESKEIISLMKKTDHLLNYIKKNDFEKEVAHLTIARVKSGELKEFVEEFSETDFGEMLVDKFVLYESVLTPEGPIYKIIKEFKLS